MQASVLIMMATFNGEKYIKEQVDSILSQSFSNFHLAIQDDGSTDGTLDILRQYTDDRIEILKNESDKHGAFVNFHVLANLFKTREKYDYYMFSDQDDLWKADKVEKFVSLLDKKDNNKPQLVYADMDLIDGKGNKIGDSVNKEIGIEYKNKCSLFFSHVVFGCNLMMNQKCFFSVPILNVQSQEVRILSHDNLYTKFAALLGKVTYEPVIMMHYRRHSSNVTSKQNFSYSLSRVFKRLFNIEDLAKDHALTYNQSLIAIHIFKKQYPDHKDLPELNNIRKAIKRGGVPALRIIDRDHVEFGKGIKTISRRLVILLGIYKKYLLSDDEVNSIDY